MPRCVDVSVVCVSVPANIAQKVFIGVFTILYCTPSFSDLLVRPNKVEVLQLDGGGVLLVWKPVQSSDPVTYCVQYCTDGGLTEIVLPDDYLCLPVFLPLGPDALSEHFSLLVLDAT